MKILIMYLLLLTSLIIPQQIENYSQLRDTANKFLSEGLYEEAFEILFENRSQFLSNDFDILYALAQISLFQNNIERCLDFLEEGHDKGYYYPFGLDHKQFKTISENERYLRIYNKNTLLLKKANENSEAEFKIILPSNFDSNRSYPIFIVLHGWSGNNERMLRLWKSDFLNENFITIYIQSSEIVGYKNYSWDDINNARHIIKSVYELTCKHYKINRAKSMIGGFSQGGKMAIDTVINGSIELCAFIALCPAGGISEILDSENIFEAHNKNKKGFIYAGEKDIAYLEALYANEKLTEYNFDHKYILVPNLNHDFPKNFEVLLDDAIRWAY